MEFAIYTSNCIGQEINCYYPQKIGVVDVESLKQAVRSIQSHDRWQMNGRKR